MKSSKNVILIGMPGSGKSTVGVVLAKVLGYRFIDSDLEIQSQEGKRLPELIEEFGTEGFLDIEARVNASIEATETRCPEAGTAAHALHLRPMQSAHQESQAEGRFYHAGGRVCSHP